MIPRLVVALGLLLAALPARAEERPDMRLGPPFPDNTERISALPWFQPSSGLDEEALRTWCAEMAAIGERQRGTRLGGDMVLAAAHTLYHEVKDRNEAHALFARAPEVYPRGDPTRALALYELGRREVWRGNFPAVARALEGLEPWARASWPKRASHADTQRWSLLAGVVDEKLPLLRADAFEGNGKHAESAAVLEALAGTTSRDARWRTKLWERAARLYARGRDRASALRAADQVIELTHDESERSYWAVWRVYANHGKVMLDGAIGPTRGIGPDAFYEDLLAVARDRSGLGGMGDTYLSMGSSAFVGGRKDVALEIYLLALRDPDFVEEAVRSGAVRGGLLVAIDIAADMERFEDAEWILESIERLAGRPIDDAETFRSNIEKARRHLDDRLRSKGREPPARKPLPEPPRKPLGTIETGDELPQDDPGATDPEPDGLPMWTWFAAGALVLLGLLRALRRR